MKRKLLYLLLALMILAPIAHLYLWFSLNKGDLPSKWNQLDCSTTRTEILELLDAEPMYHGLELKGRDTRSIHRGNRFYRLVILYGDYDSYDDRSIYHSKPTKIVVVGMRLGIRKVVFEKER